MPPVGRSSLIAAALALAMLSVVAFLSPLDAAYDTTGAPAATSLRIAPHDEDSTEPRQQAQSALDFSRLAVHRIVCDHPAGTSHSNSGADASTVGRLLGVAIPRPCGQAAADDARWFAVLRRSREEVESAFAALAVAVLDVTSESLSDSARSCLATCVGSAFGTRDRLFTSGRGAGTPAEPSAAGVTGPAVTKSAGTSRGGARLDWHFRAASFPASAGAMYDWVVAALEAGRSRNLTLESFMDGLAPVAVWRRPSDDNDDARAKTRCAGIVNGFSACADRCVPGAATARALLASALQALGAAVACDTWLRQHYFSNAHCAAPATLETAGPVTFPADGASPPNRPVGPGSSSAEASALSTPKSPSENNLIPPVSPPLSLPAIWRCLSGKRVAFVGNSNTRTLFTRLEARLRDVAQMSRVSAKQRCDNSQSNHSCFTVVDPPADLQSKANGADDTSAATAAALLPVTLDYWGYNADGYHPSLDEKFRGAYCGEGKAKPDWIIINSGVNTIQVRGPAWRDGRAERMSQMRAWMLRWATPASSTSSTFHNFTSSCLPMPHFKRYRFKRAAWRGLSVDDVNEAVRVGNLELLSGLSGAGGGGNSAEKSRQPPQPSLPAAGAATATPFYFDMWHPRIRLVDGARMVDDMGFALPTVSAAEAATLERVSKNTKVTPERRKADLIQVQSHARASHPCTYFDDPLHHRFLDAAIVDAMLTEVCPL